jgi:hypothetical protein
LRFELIAPAEARLGRGVPIALRLTNVSARAVDAHFLGRTIVFDIIVTAANGTVVWRRLGDSAVPSILQVRTLSPGEALEWKDVWQPATAGRFQLQGVLPSDDPEPRRTSWVNLEVSP